MKLLLAVAAGCFMLAACAEKDSAARVESDKHIKKMAEENRSLSVNKEEDAEDVLFSFENEEDELTEEELDHLRITGETTEEISVEEGLEDLDYLQKIWKYAYAGYEWYGGEEAFDQAYSSVKQALENLHVQEDYILIEDFRELIAEHYQFIIDQHVSVGGAPLFEKEYSYYWTEEEVFILGDDGQFYLEQNGEMTAKVLSINGDTDIGNYLMPSLDQEGQLVYTPGKYTTDLQQNPWEFELEDEEDLSLLVRSTGYDNLSDRSFNVYEEEGIPVIQFRSMMVYEDDEHDFDDMLASADAVEGEETVIIDLRNNGGGLSGFVRAWFEDVFGVEPGLGSQSARLFTNTNNAFRQQTEAFYEARGIVLETFDDEDDDFFGYEAYDFPMEPEWELEKSPHTVVDDNDTVFYVLIDQGTGSAAELMTKKLKQVNDVYVVGVPSAGILSTGNAFILELPHSHMNLSVPAVLAYQPQWNDKEAVGIQPDLWVHPRFAKDRVIQLVLKADDE